MIRWISGSGKPLLQKLTSSKMREFAVNGKGSSLYSFFTSCRYPFILIIKLFRLIYCDRLVWGGGAGNRTNIVVGRLGLLFEMCCLLFISGLADDEIGIWLIDFTCIAFRLIAGKEALG